MNQYIPKIIHHIAPSDKDDWFPLWNTCYESWKKSFPNFECILWNDEENINDFVKKFYPQYWEIYQSFPYKIMRIDFARLCILHKFGGIYSDMDVFCYEMFIDKNFKIVSVSDFSDRCSIKGQKHGIEIFLMCSELSNNFFIDCLDEIIVRFSKNKHMCQDKEYIPYITGPYVVQDLFIKTYNAENIFPQYLFSNYESFYSPKLYTRHLGILVWSNWMELDKNQRKNSFIEERYWLNEKNFDFYKNYRISYEYS